MMSWKEILMNKYTIFDIETTGLSVDDDRVIQFASQVISDNKVEKEINFLINPEIQIAKDATEKHGYSNNDLINESTFYKIRKFIIDLFNKANLEENHYLLTYNGLRYDIPLLNNELKRNSCKIEIDKSKTIDLLVFIQYHFRNLKSNRLDDIYKSFFDTEAENAHDAFGDVKLTWKIFNFLIEVEVIPKNINKLLKQQELFEKFLDNEREIFGYWIYKDRKNNKDLYIGAGKHRGILLSEVPKSYLKFILSDDKFELTNTTKEEFRKVL